LRENGSFVLLWQEPSLTIPSALVYKVREFDSQGNPKASAVEIATKRLTPSGSIHFGPAEIRILSSGKIAVAWKDAIAGTTDAAAFLLALDDHLQPLELPLQLNGREPIDHWNANGISLATGPNDVCLVGWKWGPRAGSSISSTAIGYRAVFLDSGFEGAEVVIDPRWGLSSLSTVPRLDFNESGQLVMVGSYGYGLYLKRDSLANPPVTLLDSAGSAGSPASIRVLLAWPPLTNISVQYKTLDGTAKVALADYEEASGTLTFEPKGSLFRDVIIQTANRRQSGDTNIYLFLNLSGYPELARPYSQIWLAAQALPSLSISRNAGAVQMRWQASPAQFQLEWKPYLTPNSPWYPVPPAADLVSALVPSTNSSGFFRLRKNEP
jgi:hypothetical protein